MQLDENGQRRIGSLMRDARLLVGRTRRAGRAGMSIGGGLEIQPDCGRDEQESPHDNPFPGRQGCRLNSNFHGICPGQNENVPLP